jgi:hypothetical protein
MHDVEDIATFKQRKWKVYTKFLLRDINIDTKQCTFLIYTFQNIVSPDMFGAYFAPSSGVIFWLHIKSYGSWQTWMISLTHWR